MFLLLGDLETFRRGDFLLSGDLLCGGEWFLKGDLDWILLGELEYFLTGDLTGDLEDFRIWTGLIAVRILSLKSTTRSSGFSTKTLFLDRLGELVLPLLMTEVIC